MIRFSLMKLCSVAFATGLWCGGIQAFAGGIVGNGAGLVEQNIFYAYDALAKAIESCTDLPQVCGVRSSDVVVLSKISQISQSRASSPERIQFVSEAERPGFFDTDLVQAHRLAKTGNTPADVIYWNRDQLYLKDGSPALDIPALIAIWIHELGHQAGYADHAYLDQLGAHVRFLVANTLTEVAYQTSTLNLKVLIVNFSGVTGQAELFVTDGVQSVSLTSFVRESAGCASGQPALGWGLTNGHWMSGLATSSGQSDLPFSAWLKVRCENEGQVEEFVEDFQLNLVLDMKNGKFQFLKAGRPVNRFI